MSVTEVTYQPIGPFPWSGPFNLCDFCFRRRYALALDRRRLSLVSRYIVEHLDSSLRWLRDSIRAFRYWLIGVGDAATNPDAKPVGAAERSILPSILGPRSRPCYPRSKRTTFASAPLYAAMGPGGAIYRSDNFGHDFAQHNY